jgi:hypothetical protein
MDVKVEGATVQAILVNVALDIPGMVFCAASNPNCSAAVSDFPACTPVPSLEEMLELGAVTTEESPSHNHLVRVVSDRTREYCYADGADQLCTNQLRRNDDFVVHCLAVAPPGESGDPSVWSTPYEVWQTEVVAFTASSGPPIVLLGSVRIGIVIGLQLSLDSEGGAGCVMRNSEDAAPTVDEILQARVKFLNAKNTIGTLYMTSESTGGLISRGAELSVYCAAESIEGRTPMEDVLAQRLDAIIPEKVGVMIKGVTQAYLGGAVQVSLEADPDVGLAPFFVECRLTILGYSGVPVESLFSASTSAVSRSMISGDGFFFLAELTSAYLKMNGVLGDYPVAHVPPGNNFMSYCRAESADGVPTDLLPTASWAVEAFSKPLSSCVTILSIEASHQAIRILAASPVGYDVYCGVA